MGKLLFLFVIIVTGNVFAVVIESKEIGKTQGKGYKESVINIRRDLNLRAPVHGVRIDRKFDRKPTKEGVPVVGKVMEIYIDVKKMLCENGVCIISIRLEGAKAGKVRFGKIKIYEGEYVIVRSASGDVIYKYGLRATAGKKHLWSGVIPYENIYVEYHYRGGNPKGNVVIDRVSYIWDFPEFKRKPPPPVGDPPCNAKDAVCCEDQKCFQKLKDSVALYIFTGKDGFEYICTGTLVSNASLNHDPIFLTARHCISSQQEAESATFWFGYYNSSCNPPVPDAVSNSLFVPNSTLLYAHLDGDTSLLRIDGSLRIDKKEYFLSGVLFNSKLNINSPVFGFSHPFANRLLYHTGIITGFCNSDFLLPSPLKCSPDLSPYDTVQVKWEDGGTAGGSSGSCLFYKEGQEWFCIGTLSYGEMPTAQCPPLTDYYADLSFFYNSSDMVRRIFSEGLGDDQYEDNDTMQSAYLFSLGCPSSLNIPSLIVKDMDSDYFSLSVRKGCIVDITVSFTHIWGDIDISLFDTSGNLITTSSTFNDFENINYLLPYDGSVILGVKLVDDTFQEYMLDIKTYYEQEPPVCSAIINGGATYTKVKIVSLEITASDNVFSPSELEMCVHESGKTCGGWIPFSEIHNIQLSDPDGEKTVVVRIKDPAGNTSSCQDSIILDTTPPMGGIISAVRSDVKTVTVSWSGFTDSLSGISRYILVYDTSSPPASCKEGTLLFEGTQTSFIHENVIPGYTYYYRVCAVDMAGNVSDGVSAYINVSNDPPVIKGFNASPSEGFAPLTVEFSWEVTDKEQDPLICEIDIGNNGFIDVKINGCSPPSYTFTFENPGSYPVKLIVSDIANNRTEALLYIKVNSKTPVNKPPFISYFDVYPTEGMAPLEVRVGFSVGDPDGDPLRCYIDFEGDGKNDFIKDGCTSHNVTYTYKNEGYFNLKFSVEDVKGNREIKEVTVSVIGKEEITEGDNDNIEDLLGCNQGSNFVYLTLTLMGIILLRRIKLIL